MSRLRALNTNCIVILTLLLSACPKRNKLCCLCHGKQWDRDSHLMIGDLRVYLELSSPRRLGLSCEGLSIADPCCVEC